MPPIAVHCVVGARPNFVKIAPLMREFRSRPAFAPKLIHTGQHFSPEMSKFLLDDLDIGEPDLNLEIAGGSSTAQTSEILLKLNAAFELERPDLVLVVGDVTSTLAAALTAVQMRIPLAHVEAGLRSFDRTMPEELNRIVTDALSDFLFVTEPSGVENLRRESVPDHKIFHAGNVMIDSLLRSRERAARSNVIERLGLTPRQYAVATLHRPANVDDPARLADLIGLLRDIGRELTVVFPIHPRTRQRIESLGLGCDGIFLTPPLGYLDFLRLMDLSRLVLTDSGGIQEETTVLQVPCITMRENTERPITVEQGTNCLAGVERGPILAAARGILAAPMPEGRIPVLWDGRAAVRIADVLERSLAT